MQLTDKGIARREVDEEADLTPVQQQVLASLIVGKTYTQAAQDAGINSRTIRRWREDCPAFEHSLRCRVQEIRDSCALQAASALQTAMKSLVEIASNPDHPQVFRAVQLLISLNGHLHPVSESTGVNQVEQDQAFARLQRFEARLR